MIIYFSGTGNSLTLAREIAMRTGQTLLNFRQAQEQKTIEDKIIGFLFPVHNYDMPRLFRAAVAALNFPNASYCFAVITHGGDKGNTINSLNELLEQKHTALHYYNDVIMPVNSRIMYGMKTDQIEERLEDAALELPNIIADIQAEQQSTVPPRKKLISFLTQVSDKKRLRSYLTPKVDESRCVNCGICQKACPVGNISVRNGKAFINDNCEQCTNCLHWCPFVAIHYKSRKIKQQQQYHHPAVQASDISY